MTIGCPTFPARRRSFILLAVLVITASALLVATSLLFAIDASLAGSAGERDRTQMRMLAWSGVRAVASRLDEQRDRILGGELAELDDEYVIYETDGVVGRVRLLPVTEGDDLLAPESARVDLNTADAAALAATGLVEAPTAAAIVAYRDGPRGGAFQSVAELLDVPGVDFETVYGPIEDIEIADDAVGTTRDLGERVGDRLSDASPRGLADVVTVHAVEPALQRTGVKRINLNTVWSEELGRRVDERFGEGSGAALQRIMQAGTSFEDESRIVQVLRFFAVEAQEWPDLLDALTAETGDYHFGRLNINAASTEALMTLPGIGAEEAAQIVRVRDGLSEDDRSTIVWPLLREIVPAEAYDDLAGRITTRSWTYRVRLAAFEERSRVGDDGEDAVPVFPVIVEAVIDLCDPQARIAYLRDITHLETAAILASNASFDSEEQSTAVDESDAAARDSAGAEGLEDALDGGADQGRSRDENRPGEGVLDDGTLENEASRPVGSSPRAAAGAVPVRSDSRSDGGSAGRGGADAPDATGAASGTGGARSGDGRHRVGRWRPGG